MRLPHWLGGKPVELTEQASQYAEALRQEQESNLLLAEQLTELQASLVEPGWESITGQYGTSEFNRDGLKRIAALCRLTAVANPLVKRGVSLRVSYVWGQGVQIGARAKGDDQGEQDVNAVVQGFLDDPSNRTSWTGSQAREEKERALATDGNICAALFTSPLTGRVQVRTLPWEEITDVICNPEDRDEPWFYRREWTARNLDPMTGQTSQDRQVVYYPALDIASGIPTGPGRKLRARPKTISDAVTEQAPIQWDAPVVHVKVNALDGWKFGIPDVYAVLPWSRAYKEFLEDWAKLVKSLSRFAWRLTTKGSRVGGIAAKLRAANPGQAGDVAASDPNVQLEAIPKSGATIDSESGRPLAAMVAAGLGVPVTMLLGDPGTTGARATAETLDRPTELEMGGRRELWMEVEQRILRYVIDSNVRAPQGALKGTVTRDDAGRDVVTLKGDKDGSMRTVDVSFPSLDDIPVETLVRAISEADATGKVPPLVIARLLLEALGVDDIDEVLQELVDDQGNFVDPDTNAGQAAVDAFNRGEDPAAVLRGAQPPAQQPAEPNKLTQ